MAHRCLSLLGTPDLWTRLGWLQSSTRNGMKWGVLTLLEIPHSRGCYLKFAVLLVQRVCSPKRPNTKRPRALSPGGLYSWWHLVSPANRSRSRDCALVTWAYGAPCPAMVSPNAGLHKEDKLLYPDHHLIWCVESGFGPAQCKNSPNPFQFMYQIRRLDGFGRSSNTIPQNHVLKGWNGPTTASTKQNISFRCKIYLMFCNNIVTGCLKENIPLSDCAMTEIGIGHNR